MFLPVQKRDPKRLRASAGRAGKIVQDRDPGDVVESVLLLRAQRALSDDEYSSGS